MAGSLLLKAVAIAIHHIKSVVPTTAAASIDSELVSHQRRLAAVIRPKFCPTGRANI